MSEKDDLYMAPHESAINHVTGDAAFIDDIPLPPGTLHGIAFLSPAASGHIRGFRLEEALAVPGVRAIVSALDIPGHNQVGPVVHDEVLLAEGKLEYHGQAVFLLAADNLDSAHRALKLIDIDIEEEKPILSIEDAEAASSLLQAPRLIQSGDIDKALADSDLIISGSLYTGAQEHWYLETQAAIAIPGEDQTMKILSSTQHPAETQAIVAEILGRKRSDISVEVKRLGGAFGGKETQANHTAAWAALLAAHTRRPVKFRLSREDDQRSTGKRHPYRIDYRAGFLRDGKLNAYDVVLNSNAGHATDLSMAIMERAVFHATNAYYCPNTRIIGKAWRTNLVSHTAFRGFGGPQAMAAIEMVMDKASRGLGIDGAQIRSLNFYEMEGKRLTPYGQAPGLNPLPEMWEELLASSEYKKRRKEIRKFNQKETFRKRGIAISPVMFGISFTTTFLNQGAAQVNIYRDGSVLLSHGGIEMGQGLHSKMLRIASEALGITESSIRIAPTRTDVIPNTSATAASSGSDLNGMAILDAIAKLKQRISPLVRQVLEIPNNEEDGELIFADGYIGDGTESRISFADAVNLCYMNRVSLSANGFYATPGIFYDKERGKGSPFHYYAYGAAVSEIEMDLHTGRVSILRTDILHDSGKSVNRAIDKGQVIGGFVQGLGWICMEECLWDSHGRPLHHSPDTYKIPTFRDIPTELRVRFTDMANTGNLKGSKAIGEPPFMLAFSVWLAIMDAMEAASPGSSLEIGIPATPEKILLSLHKS